MGKHSADTTLSSRLPTVGELLEMLPDGWLAVPGLHAIVPELAGADHHLVGLRETGDEGVQAGHVLPPVGQHLEQLTDRGQP